jgi:hypothetical protein
MPETGVGYDQTGTPSLFRNTNALQSFMGQYPGTVGTRGIVRGPQFFNLDMSVSKKFPLPIEGHSIQFRAEAFNVLNTVNFNNPNTLSISSNVATFGQLTSTADPRILQFALRYEF